MSRVLLVEDDAWLAQLEVGVLEGAGYEVVHAGHAPAAIVALESGAFDAYIIDILLAGSTAFALLHELRSYDDTVGVPIIACTNLAEQFQNGELDAYGVQRVIDKTTMQPDDLVTALRSVL